MFKTCSDAFLPTFRQRAQSLEVGERQKLYLEKFGDFYGLNGKVLDHLNFRSRFEGLGPRGEVRFSSRELEPEPEHAVDVLFGRDNLVSSQISFKRNVDEYWKKIYSDEPVGPNELGFQLTPEDGSLEKIRKVQGELARIYAAGLESGSVPRSTLKRIYQDIFKYEELARVYEGKSSSLPISMLMSLPESVTLPKYYYGASERYKAVRGNLEDGLSSLFFDGTRMLQKDKKNYDNLFESFVDHLYYDPILDPSSGIFARSFSYMDSDEVQFGFHVFLPKALKERLESGGGGRSIGEQYLNLSEDIRQFVGRRYKEHMNISDADLKKLMDISASVEDRTISIVSTRQGHAQISYDRTFGDIVEEFVEKDFSHFEIEGAVNAVYSRGAGEKLPLEMFTGYTIPRKSEGEALVEVGRLAVAGEKVTSEAFFRAMAALVRNVEDVSRVVLEADVARARIFKKFGFKPIHKRVNFEGKTEFIMEARPDTIYERVSELYKAR